MIILISKKDICKYIKTIAGASDYILFNGTDSPKVLNFATAGETMSALQPKKSLIVGDDSGRRYESNLKAWLKDDRLYETIAIAGAWQLSSDNEDGNAYFILENKVHKKFAKKLKRRILHVFGIDPDNNRTVFIFDPDNIAEHISGESSSELNKIDKMIEKAKHDDDEDRANKLRKKRSNIDNDDSDKISKKDIRRFLKKNAHISKNNEKCIRAFLKKYKSHHKQINQ